MTMLEMTAGVLDEVGSALADAGPVRMVNLVRYRARADYGDRADLPPCSGRDAYLGRYAPTFAEVAAAVAPGATFNIVMLAGVRAMLVAPANEAWDDVAIVEYPSFEVLRRIISSARYEADAAPHRRAALADWRFIATIKTDLGA